MWTKRLKLWRYLLCMLFAVSTLALAARADDDVPLESQCRPYIEKALKELESGDTEPDTEEKQDSSEISIDNDTKEDISTEDGAALPDDDSKEQADSQEVEDAPSVEVADEPYVSQVSYEDEQEVSADNESKEDNKGEENETGEESAEQTADEGGDSKETASADEQEDEKDSGEEIGQAETQEESTEQSQEEAPEDDGSKEDTQEDTQDDTQDSKEGEEDSKEEAGLEEESKEGAESEEAETASLEEEGKAEESEEESQEEPAAEQEVEEGDDSKETKSEEEDGSQEKPEKDETVEESQEVAEESQEEGDKSQEEGDKSQEEGDKSQEEEDKSKEEEGESVEQKEESQEKDVSAEQGEEDVAEKSEETDAAEGETEGGEEGQEPSEEAASEEEAEGAPEEDLLLTGEIPENLRSRDHIIQILRLDEEASESELIIEKSADIVLRDLKRVYENSIKPLEGLYKYRDLSNRHFGDPEIFSKPLVLFMGPWSGGKSSILNYLTGLEFTEWSLRTGAEPSPAYFNILMHGKDPEVLDGTQLAADWTFSGLQKFGQGLEERLRGLKYPSKLLEKVNIVEIPGILEVRKQVSRVFPFNDACQWFIDRADIIFLVYDPSKLDVGPETEAILDQLKGRESQTRIVLNKADSVKPEELMRVQSALIWNISPLMSSPQPPVMYTVSLWSIPFEATAPVRLLQAQERELLRDLRQAVDKRIENKIASARRFAVRVRNHAKMVDCYLTTYYNHKTIFGNRKLIADAIIENPQNYHIYEGLSTLTNISRYDLPDPETYRDFFRLNPLYEFQQLSATCTYFRGCPINKLDVAIAYDLPELVGKYKKMVETATPQGMPKS